MTILLFILGLVLFIALVLVHEWGHFIMARRNGVEVEEFGLGFPPRAKVLTKKNGTVYTLNWLPLGGFVKLKGEHDSDQDKGTFGSAPLWAKVKIMMAGVFMNLVVALVLLTILGLVGMPQLISKANGQSEDQFTVASNERITQDRALINYIEPDSPAQKAGLLPLDEIESISVNGESQAIRGVTDLKTLSSSNPGQKLTFSVVREGKPMTLDVQIRSAQEVEESLKTSEPKGYVGVGVASYQIKKYTWGAPVVAAGTAVQVTKLTVKGIGNALKGLGGTIAGLVTGNTKARQAAQVEATKEVSGPLGIFFILKMGAQQGVVMIMFIIALISLTLAIMNTLPIPALDGGRLFVTLLFRAAKKPLTEDMEDAIHGTGFAVLMVLFLLITIVDAKRFF